MGKKQKSSKAPDAAPDATSDLASLNARAIDLRKDIDALFDRCVEASKIEHPGVPEQVLRGLLMRNQGCRCALVAAMVRDAG